MHDARLEDQLRRQLRTSVDSLPFTITAENLERTLAARRRKRMVRRGWLAAAAAAVVLVAGVGAILGLRAKDQPSVGVSPSPSGTPSAIPAAVEPAWLAIAGPADWQPDPGFEMQVDGKAWIVAANNGGGVTTVDLGEASRVTVSGVGACATVVAFTAQPGRMYVVRFAADDSAVVEDWTANGVDSGPRIGGPVAPKCSAAAKDTVDAPKPIGSSIGIDGLAANDAVTVRYVGATGVDPLGTLVVEAIRLGGTTIAAGPTAVEIARIPSSTFPAGFGPSNSGFPSFSPVGWLAVPLQAGTVDAPILALAIFDLRDLTAAPWIVDNADQASFGPDGRFAIAIDTGVMIADPAAERLTSIAAPTGTTLRAEWSADGRGVLALESDSGAWGIVDVAGTMTASSGMPDLYQRTGVERPAAADGRTAGQGCDSSGQPGAGGGCFMSVGDVNWATETDGGIPSGWSWNASGTGLFAIFRASSAASSNEVRLDLLTGPGARSTIASVQSTQNDAALFVGITGDDSPQAADRVFLVGGSDGSAYLAISGSGAATELSGAWFAGWGAAQPTYPAG